MLCGFVAGDVVGGPPPGRWTRSRWVVLSCIHPIEVYTQMDHADNLFRREKKGCQMQNKPKGNALALRKGRWSEKNQIYLITTNTFNRMRVFDDFYHARKLIGFLKTESDMANCTTLAFVVMPDHLHWLMQLQVGELSIIVGRVKSLMARELGGQIWQAGFHDHAVRAEEDVRAIARYIIMNPIRAGLVDKAGLYPHWDALWV